MILKINQEIEVQLNLKKLQIKETLFQVVVMVMIKKDLFNKMTNKIIRDKLLNKLTKIKTNFNLKEKKLNIVS